jgi:arginyl-tRNA synthetase
MRRPGTEGGTGNGPDEEAKVIVRSNGTVTYVGKDIAYHLWKFGKLDKLDFYKKEFYPYPGDKKCFISCLPDPSNLQIEPSYFGKADAVYNVIDSRQTDPQNNVIEALRGMGLTREADYYHHFSYEMVALTPRCAEELGHALSDEDRARPFIEVSGRKGSGVKADDLIDKMEGAALAEVTQRHPELEEAKRRSIASQIAVGALRYYMLRYTRNTIIAFDFKDALSFEGETGPYAQYAAVRAANILRKAGKTQDKALAEYANAAISVDMDDSVWAVWLAASRSIYVLEQSIRALEPAYLAKYVFQLAQQFNNFYHQHPVLTEDDPARKRLLLATVAVALRELKRSLGWLGISAPEMM